VTTGVTVVSISSANQDVNLARSHNDAVARTIVLLQTQRRPVLRTTTTTLTGVGNTLVFSTTIEHY
jgi:hypothetical protein